MHALKLTQIGNAVGVVLPEELLARLKLGQGDSVYLVEMPEGFVLLPHDPAIAEQVELGREFMNAFRDTFHALAK